MKTFLLSIPKGLPSLLMLVAVFYFTFADNPLNVNALKLFPYAEQVGHLVLYFALALVFILDYAKAVLPHHSKINVEIALAAIASVIALIMEIGLMFYTNGFNYSLMNWFAAILGAALAFVFYRYWLMHPMRHYLYHSIQHHWRYQHRRRKK